MVSRGAWYFVEKLRNQLEGRWFGSIFSADIAAHIVNCKVFPQVLEELMLVLELNMVGSSQWYLLQLLCWPAGLPDGCALYSMDSSADTALLGVSGVQRNFARPVFCNIRWLCSIPVISGSLCFHCSYVLGEKTGNRAIWQHGSISPFWAWCWILSCNVVQHQRCDWSATFWLTQKQISILIQDWNQVSESQRFTGRNLCHSHSFKLMLLEAQTDASESGWLSCCTPLI